jgi:hypothetical protein
VNASENMWTQCHIHGFGTLLDIGENVNAVNHILVATTVEAIYGDVFKIAGGSNIGWFGGSCIHMAQGPSQSYFMAVRPTTVSLVGTHEFYGVRLELDQNQALAQFSNLLLIDATAQPTAFTDSFCEINFHSCSFYNTQNPARNTLQIDAATRMVVNFIGCDGLDLPVHQLNFNSTKTGLQAASPGPFTAVNFLNGTAVPFANITYTNVNSVGRASARNCRNTLDYDLTANGRSEASGGRNVPLKTATIWGAQWPDAGLNSGMAITLPPNCLIKAVRFRKAANAGVATAGYQLAMTDNNLNAYASSTIAAQNALHSGQADNINIIASTGAIQAMNVVAVAGQLGSAQAIAMVASDYAMVDYY